MTIVLSPGRAAALAATGTINNPFVTGSNFADTAVISTTAGIEASGGQAANAASGTTFDFWSVTPNPSVAMWQAEFASPVAPSFVGIAAHNLADVGATVRVQYSDDGVSFTDVSAGVVAPEDNQAIGFRIAPVAARYWRVRISDLTGPVAVGVIWIGEEIVIPRRLYQGYAPPITPTEVNLQSNVSEGGHLLGSSVTRQGSAISAAIQYLPPSFLRGAKWQDFQNRFNEGQGTFWAWRPGKYGDLHFGWRAGSPIVPQNSGPLDLMSVQMNLRLYDDV